MEQFAFKTQNETHFSALENIYPQMSEALLNLIKQDNEQFELLSYDGHIVKFYYNSKYNKPLVGL